MNMVLEKRGEPFVRDCITDVFARWGKTGDVAGTRAADEAAQTASRRSRTTEPRHLGCHDELDDTLTDPMGAPVPKLNL